MQARGIGGECRHRWRPAFDAGPAPLHGLGTPVTCWMPTTCASCRCTTCESVWAAAVPAEAKVDRLLQKHQLLPINRKHTAPAGRLSPNHGPAHFLREDATLCRPSVSIGWPCPAPRCNSSPHRWFPCRSSRLPAPSTQVGTPDAARHLHIAPPECLGCLLADAGNTDPRCGPAGTTGRQVRRGASPLPHVATPGRLFAAYGGHACAGTTTR